MDNRERLLTRVRWEKDKRRIMSDGFVPFCNAFGYDLARHHKIMAEKLERAIHEPGYNVIISMPPGHAKSTYASVLFPSYYLGRYNKKNVIMATHTQDLSDKWGRQTKRIISSEKYRYIFGVSLRSDSKAASRFDISNGSEYYGSGISGNVTGHRGDILIMDDLIKGIEDADSITIRDKIWNAYLYDIKTRIKPNASKIMIGTRWHEDDIIGRILISKDSKNWDIINFPALIETEEDKETDLLHRDIGEALWPEYITADMLKNERDSLDSKDIRMWNSLYQGKPTFEEGNYFKKDWIQRIDYLPDDLDMYGASDYAVTEGGGDYTVHGIVGYDSKNNKIYIADIWRKQTTPDIWIDKFISMGTRHKTLVWAEENGQIIKSLDSYIRKEMSDRKQFIYRKQYASSADKTTRARSIQAQMAQGNVYIVNGDWTDDFVKELLSFPSGKHDDQVDFLSLIGRLLDEMRKANPPKVKEKAFQYSDNMITLPSINDKIKNSSSGSFRKI